MINAFVRPNRCCGGRDVKLEVKDSQGIIFSATQCSGSCGGYAPLPDEKDWSPVDLETVELWGACLSYVAFWRNGEECAFSTVPAALKVLVQRLLDEYRPL